MYAAGATTCALVHFVPQHSRALPLPRHPCRLPSAGVADHADHIREEAFEHDMLQCTVKYRNPCSLTQRGRFVFTGSVAGGCMRLPHAEFMEW